MLLFKRSLRSPYWVLPLLGFCVVLLLWGVTPMLSRAASPQTKVFEQVWKTVNDNFFDGKFNGVDWQALRQKYAAPAAQAPDSAAFAKVVNQMLGELNTSHTRYYTPKETAYYQLLGIFQPRNPELKNLPKSIFPRGKLEYSGIGMFTQAGSIQASSAQVGKNKIFVSGVLEGSPAEQAGLQIGDELLSVDDRPFQAVESFAGKVGQPVKLVIQRSPDPASRRELTVTPKLLDPLTMFLDAQKASIKIFQRDGKKIGYVHIWSYAGDQYQEQLEEDLLSGRLREADVLVLDLRNGWGGAPLNALNVYTARGPSITSVPRNGRRYTYYAQWKKPVVMLVNEGSRSAKEILAYGFRQYGIGPVVGSKTPGAVVGGRAFLMEDGSLLYVAVADVYVDGNQRLEGKGVVPDIEVPFSVEYAQGADPQRERAIAVAVQQLTQPPQRSKSPS